MSAYETVVVGVYDSETAMRAVRMAAVMAAETGAKLHLVAAYSAGGQSAGGDANPYEAAASGPADKALRRAAAICAEAGAQEAETHAVAGDPVTALNAAVKEHDADLLVIGSHGLQTLGGRLLGSVPGGVSREAECDVFIVHTTVDRLKRMIKPRFRYKLLSKPTRTVVVGVHDSARSLRAAEKAGAVAADVGAELILVGAYEPAEKKEMAYASDTLGKERHLAEGTFAVEIALADGEARARKAGATHVSRVIVKGDPMNGLVKVAAKRKADVMVLGNHQLTGRAAQLLGSVSSQVSRKTAQHILLVH